jgi:small-conductance mechanosensitive channel
MFLRTKVKISHLVFIEQVNVYRERRALSLSLSDTKTAVNKLHQILNVILFTILIIIWLLVLGIATKNLLVFVSSQLLLVVFIFGNTCKNIFEAIVFLFVLHPFDVGDRCIIDGTQVHFYGTSSIQQIFMINYFQ